MGDEEEKTCFFTILLLYLTLATYQTRLFVALVIKYLTAGTISLITPSSELESGDFNDDHDNNNKQARLWHFHHKPARER